MSSPSAVVSGISALLLRAVQEATSKQQVATGPEGAETTWGERKQDGRIQSKTPAQTLSMNTAMSMNTAIMLC